MQFVHFRRSSLCAAVLSLGLTGAVQAAAITWNAPETISNDADVVTSGSLAGAVNVNGVAASVNGVNFQPMLANWGTTPGGSASAGIFSMTGGSSVSTESASTVFSGFASLGAAYAALVGTAVAWPYHDMTLTMSGLSVGQQYLFQVWVNHSDDGERYLFGTNVDPGALPLSAGSSGPSGIDFVVTSLGEYVVGTFTADAATQDIVFAPDEVGYISGFQLRALDAQSVPEPGTLALAALGLAGMGWRRARRA